MTNETKPIKIPNAEHPITIDANTVRVVARVGDTVIADSTATLTLRESRYAPVYYFPLNSVAPGTVRPSSTQTYCPYKGDASYYDVLLSNGEVLSDAVWTYQTPYQAVAAIAGRVAFYTDRVQIVVEQVAVMHVEPMKSLCLRACRRRSQL
jgi:uncharacterized protein (DUF427 family)